MTAGVRVGGCGFGDAVNEYMAPEQLARRDIDEQLEACGWVVQDYKSAAVAQAPGVAVREVPTTAGPADYVLYVDGQAVGVIEAKKAGMTLTGVEPQTRKYQAAYPEALPAVEIEGALPFGYESTGAETRFTSGLDPVPASRRVFTFHRPETLARWLADHAEGKGREPGLRAGVVHLPGLDADAGHLWPAQEEAIRNLEQSFKDNRPRALIQMATGSGKTFTAANVCYRLLRYAGAQRILFLVDRANLGRQALRVFQGFATPDDGGKFTELYNVRHLTSSRLDMANEAATKVHICTIQRLHSILRGEDELDEAFDEEKSGFDTAPPEPVEVSYNPAVPIESYDLIVIDECHRSIYGVWRQVLEYFDVFRIRTEITESGGVVPAGFVTEFRDRETRKRRLEKVDTDIDYDANQLDKRVVAPDQLRTIVRTLRNSLPEIFPDRERRDDGSLRHVPKTLIFAKDDYRAEDILKSVRQEFNFGNQEAVKPLAGNSALREKLIDVRRSYEQMIDTASKDQVISGQFSRKAADRARAQVESWRQFIDTNRDEITALQVLYSQPYGGGRSYADIRELANAIKRPPRRWTPDALWEAYETLDKSKVRGSGHRASTDLVSLVRYTLGEADVLVSYPDLVNERFEAWLMQQSNAGRTFSQEQAAYLELIKDRVAANLGIEPAELAAPPFSTQGGLGKARQLFGTDLDALLAELSQALAA